MKLWSSYLKEMKLASRGFYFYIELIVAVMILLVLLFVVPENFQPEVKEVLYLDMPSPAPQVLQMGLGEPAAFDEEYADVAIHKVDNHTLYLAHNAETLKLLARREQAMGVHISLNETGKLRYEYVLQGHETQRFQNLLTAISVNQEADVPITVIGENKALGDRQNILPVILAFNGTLMGVFIIAAYIFLDKGEHVISAFAMTPSSVLTYLISKVLVLITTGLFSSLLVTIPLAKLQANYLMIIALTISAGLFSGGLGLFVASFYKDIMQSIGALFLIIFLFLTPIVSYLMPSFRPDWIEWIPSYPLVMAYRETLYTKGNIGYILQVCGVMLLVGAVLLYLSKLRYERTMSV